MKVPVGRGFQPVACPSRGHLRDCKHRLWNRWPLLHNCRTDAGESCRKAKQGTGNTEECKLATKSEIARSEGRLRAESCECWAELVFVIQIYEVASRAPGPAPASGLNHLNGCLCFWLPEPDLISSKLVWWLSNLVNGYKVYLSWCDRCQEMNNLVLLWQAHPF